MRGSSKSGRRPHTNLSLVVALIIWMIISPTLSAQNGGGVPPKTTLRTISGQLLDQAGDGIADSGVALWRSGDSTLIAAGLTDIEGRFSFKDLPEADYFLNFGGLFYEKKRTEVHLYGKDVVLPPTTLRDISEELSGVTVTSKRPLIKVLPGEVRYRVSLDPLVKNATLYQAMQRLPMVSPSSGGFLIKGTKTPTYYLNGLPAPALNRNPREALKAMQAEQVVEIRLITIPGAGYDGDLSGGVIDIITKRKFESQVTGSVGVTGNTRRQYGGNGYIATQLGKVSLQGNVLFSDQTGYTERWGLERVALSETKNHRFEQNKERVYDRNRVLTASALLAWEPSENSLWNATFNYLNLDTRGTGTQRHAMYAPDDTPVYRFGVDEKSTTIYRSIDLSTAFQYKWGKSALLLLMYRYSDMPKMTDETFLLRDTEGYSGESRHFEQTTQNGERTLQGDFSYSWSEAHKLSTGVKGIIRVNSSASRLMTQMQGETTWTEQADPEDRFNHRQSILGIYAEYRFRKEPWVLTFGLRDEYTRERISYALRPDNDCGGGFNDLLFSLKATYNFSGGGALGLSYKSAITRPSIYHLNPRWSTRDPSYVYYGNPYLRSEKEHAFGAEWTHFSGNLILNLSGDFRLSPNAIQADYGTLPDGTMYRTFSNSGRRGEWGISGYAAYTFSDAVSASLNAFGSYRTLRGDLGGKPVSRQGWSGGVSPSVDITFPKEYYLKLYGGYNFPSITLEGTGYNFYHCSATLSKSFFGDRLNLSLTALDFFWGTKNYLRTYETPDFRGSSSYENYGFLLELGVTYRFNSKEIEVRKTSKQIHNSDVADFKEW